MGFFFLNCYMGHKYLPLLLYLFKFTFQHFFYNILLTYFLKIKSNFENKKGILFKKLNFCLWILAYISTFMFKNYVRI